MVRRQREPSTTEEEIVIDAPPPKKHKKHKHKKHKHQKIEEEYNSDSSIEVSFEDIVERPAYKSKHKMRDYPSTSAADILKAQTIRSTPDPRKPNPSSCTPPKLPKDRKKRIKEKDSGTSSEEERWLDAIKSGKLEEVDDELKKIKPKDPKMMTARQRAMYERGADKDTTSPATETLLSLPSGYKEKVMTAEAIQKAALKSQKRKQLADEKREKDKKKTIDRLLKKQDSKNIKGALKTKPAKKLVPTIVYKNNVNEISLMFPPGIPFPLESKTQLDPPKPIKCGLRDCSNLKKYSCSKTGVPLCSLECYKKNMQLLVT